MDRQTLVRHVRTGQIGVVVDDPFGGLGNFEEEVPVVWEGYTEYRGMRPRRLEVIGPENAVADMVKCGGGRGEECCIFLTFGEGGWQCQRFGGLRYRLQVEKSRMKAKREPVEMFPKCQVQE